MATFNSLLKKATSLLKIGGLDTSLPKPALDGDVTFCKNNVCVHPPSVLRPEVTHHPGYLTIREQTDDILGSTLILTWIPNSTLEKNPRSLENRTPESSPCRSSFSSKCPSPTPSGKSPFHLPSSRSNLANSSSEKSMDILHELSPDHSLKIPDSDNADVHSISSTVSDIGSPREDYESLESFSNSDQTEMTASTSSQLMSNDFNDLHNCEALLEETGSKRNNHIEASTTSLENGLQSQSDSGIGPEEVVAALEKMICGLNDIESSKQDTNFEEKCKIDCNAQTQEENALDSDLCESEEIKNISENKDKESRRS